MELRNKKPYIDSRGEPGTSGPLITAEDESGKKYLIKTYPWDVANEYVAHKIAKLIGVPTTDAELFRDGNKTVVGIEFADDLKRVSMDDFLGLEKPAISNLPFTIGNKYKPLEITELKYPDDSPFLADLMKYMAFRRLVVLDDNVQIGFSHGRLISFDYAESFYIDEISYNLLLNTKNLTRPLSVFFDHFFFDGCYTNSIRILRRKDSEQLSDPFLSVIDNFLDADFNPLIDSMVGYFPDIIVQFYSVCLEMIIKELTK